jgi:hypothetical protein
MAENKETIKVEVFKPDTTIKLELSVNYVMRFNQFLLEFIPFKDEEHFKTTMEKVKNNQQDDEFSFHTTTLLSFLTLCENAAREQGLLDMIDIDKETGEKVESSID